MNKSALIMHGCGANFRTTFHKCAPEMMGFCGYPVHQKISPHWDWHATRKNEFIRRMMIFNR